MKNTSAELTRIQAIEPVSYVPFKCGAEWATGSAAAWAKASPHEEMPHTPTSKASTTGIIRTIALDPFTRVLPPTNDERTVRSNAPWGFRSDTTRGQQQSALPPKRGGENARRTGKRRVVWAKSVRMAHLQKERQVPWKGVSETRDFQAAGLIARQKFETARLVPKSWKTRKMFPLQPEKH
jgi:hypothetical protein